MSNGTDYRYFAYVARMTLVERDERYVELNDDERTGSYYMEDYFDTEDEAIAFVKREIAYYNANEFDGKGYKVARVGSGLDPIEYCEGAVERHCFDGDDIIDYGDNPDSEHYYDGYYECSLPDDVRKKADKVEHEYHRYLDFEASHYGSLADMLAE